MGDNKKDVAVPEATAAKQEQAPLSVQDQLAKLKQENEALLAQNQKLETENDSLSEALTKISAEPAKEDTALTVVFNKRKYKVNCGVQIPTAETFEFEGKQYTCNAGSYSAEQITSNSSILAKLLKNGSNVITEVK